MRKEINRDRTRFINSYLVKRPNGDDETQLVVSESTQLNYLPNEVSVVKTTALLMTS